MNLGSSDGSLPADHFAQVRLEVQQNWRVYLLSAGVAFGAMINGWDIGLIGGVLVTPSFQTAFGLLSDKASASYRLAQLKGNIVSILQAGCFVGAAGGLYLPARIGHRRTLIISALIFVVGSIVQTSCLVGYAPGKELAKSAGLPQLYLGRLIGGCGVGLSSAVGPSYITEISPAKIRGRVTGCWQFFGLTGIMLAFFVNYGVSKAGYGPLDTRSWRLPFALQLIPGAIFLIAVLMSPESPRWLFERRNDEGGARQSLASLYGCGTHDGPVEEVMAEIRRDVALSSMNNALFLRKQNPSVVPDNHDRDARSPVLSATLAPSQQTKGLAATNAPLNWRVILSHPVTMYRLSIAAFLFMFQQLTGTNSLNYYSPTIFRALGVRDDLLATGLYGIIKVVTSMLANIFAAEQLGRKWSLILSGVGQSLCLVWIGIFLRFRPPTADQTSHNTEHATQLDAVALVTVIVLFCYVGFYSLGWAGGPWVAGNELAPTHTQLRSIAMALGNMNSWIFNAIIAKVTPLMLESIKYGTFLVFASTMLSGVLWVIFFMPEPAGWPLEQTDVLFEGGHLVQRSLADLSPRKRAAFKQEKLAQASATEASVIKGI